MLLRVTLTPPTKGGADDLATASLAGSAEVVDAKTGHVYWRNAGIRVSDTSVGGALELTVVSLTGGSQVRARFADLVVSSAFPAKR